VSASVGIAMGGSGSDTALENAEIVLMGDDIGHVPEVVRLGKRTLSIIRQNLIFALGVIVTLIVLTFLDRLTLAAGVIGHEGSTILVVFNSLRLLRSSGDSSRVVHSSK
jgi:Zn2+/Cd2+-exporting ATPase